MKMVNPNEAPDGYEARPFDADKHSCTDCALSGLDRCGRFMPELCRASDCLAEDRVDGCDAYFIKKEQPK